MSSACRLWEQTTFIYNICIRLLVLRLNANHCMVCGRCWTTQHRIQLYANSSSISLLLRCRRILVQTSFCPRVGIRLLYLAHSNASYTFLTIALWGELSGGGECPKSAEIKHLLQVLLFHIELFILIYSLPVRFDLG